jgi:hydroxymethylbilane synthase
VIAAMQQAFPDFAFEPLIVKTTGDHMQIQSAATKDQEATKNIFTHEIEEVLLAADADMAVHSCKDLGVAMPAGLIVAGSPPRRSPQDVLIVRAGVSLTADEPAVILTGSIRRRLQWQERFPQHEVLPIRGNIDTRIRKLQEHPDAAALILAKAGLDRLAPELGKCQVQSLSVDEMLPAPGQGALALQCRESDEEMIHIIESISDYVTFQSILAERSFLAAMDAGCQEPLGALATPIENGGLKMSAVYYFENDPQSARRCEVIGSIESPEHIGQALAQKFEA